MLDNKKLFGRTVIYTEAKKITAENVVETLKEVIPTYEKNKSEIDYLYNYYKGKQPILDRVKDVRPEIMNTMVENRANEIVSFKVGYLMGEPIQYIGRNGDETVSENINKLNEYVFAEDKPSQDKELAEWFTICGTAYRAIFPDSFYEDEIDESPFEIYTLDPRNTFVVYNSGLGNKPVMGVTFYQNKNKNKIYGVYTENEFFQITDDKITERKSHSLNSIPIIEYPANSARLGAFEIVLPLLDALNNMQSNRLDGVEQFIQALMVFVNCDIDDEKFKEMGLKGAIKIISEQNLPSNVYYLNEQLDQSQTQTLVDYLYQTILIICGMPNRNGGSSTSDTGSAVIMRDGWSAAEARAKDSELVFKKSEKQFLKLALRIARDMGGINLGLKDIEIQFTRRNYENIQSKVQVLIAMLNNDKIHPKLAFEHCGMFADPEASYLLSKEWSDINNDSGSNSGDSSNLEAG